MKNQKSIIKWTGSKRYQAQLIIKLVPSNFGNYYEPFLGGGSILYNFTNKQCFVSDIYQPLIELWTLIQQKPDELIVNYSNQWEQLQTDFPNYYYDVRNNFNLTKSPFDLNFLTRTCINGNIRFNLKGYFNSSIHLTRRGIIPNNFSKIVYDWSDKIQNVVFSCCDYTDILNLVVENDFVYLDPPYMGIKGQRYITNLNFDKYCLFLEELNRKKVFWMSSFDGARGSSKYIFKIPLELYKKEVEIENGLSSTMLLNKKKEIVREKLYMNYDKQDTV